MSLHEGSRVFIPSHHAWRVVRLFVCVSPAHHSPIFSSLSLFSPSTDGRTAQIINQDRVDAKVRHSKHMPRWLICRGSLYAASYVSAYTREIRAAVSDDDHLFLRARACVCVCASLLCCRSQCVSYIHHDVTEHRSGECRRMEESTNDSRERDFRGW